MKFGRLKCGKGSDLIKEIFIKIVRNPIFAIPLILTLKKSRFRELLSVVNLT